MIDKLIRQLESSDPKKRMQAVRALAKTGDRTALKPLLKVYKNDPDPKVRDLALKAGRYIKNHAAPSSSPGGGGGSTTITDSMEIPAYHDEDAAADVYDDGGYSYDDGEAYDDAADDYSYDNDYGYESDSSYDDYAYADTAADDDEDAYGDGGYIFDGDTSHRESLYADSITDTMMMPALSISEQQHNKALSMLDEVEDYKWKGQTDKAIETLSKALQMDPKLWKNSYALGLIRSVTKKAPGEAYDMLMGDMAVKRKKRKKKEMRLPDEVTWGDAFVDLIIYGVVFALLVLIPGLIGLDFFKDSLAETGSAQAMGMTPAEYEDFLEFMDSITPVVVAIVAVAVGVIMAVTLFIQDIGIHIAALIFFTGDGSLKALIRKTTLFYAFSYAVMGIMFFSIFWPGLIPEEYAGGMLMGIGLAGMFVFGWSLHLISEVYHFGMAKGCGSVFIGGILVNLATSWIASQLAGVSMF